MKPYKKARQFTFFNAAANFARRGRKKELSVSPVVFMGILLAKEQRKAEENPYLCNKID